MPQFGSEAEAREWIAEQTPGPQVRATQYEVSILPEDDINYRLYAVQVRRRSDGEWMVVNRAMDACYGLDGVWADGVKPYGRGDDWVRAHRFDEETALRLAREAAPQVTVNGITAAQALERLEQENTDGWFSADALKDAVDEAKTVLGGDGALDEARPAVCDLPHATIAEETACDQAAARGET